MDTTGPQVSWREGVEKAEPLYSMGGDETRCRTLRKKHSRLLRNIKIASPQGPAILLLSIQRKAGLQEVPSAPVDSGTSYHSHRSE